MPDETFAGEDESAIESRKSSRSSRRLTKKSNLVLVVCSA